MNNGRRAMQVQISSPEPPRMTKLCVLFGMVRGFFHSDRAPHSSQCGVWLDSPLKQPRYRTAAGDRASVTGAPRLWNCLPADIIYHHYLLIQSRNILIYTCLQKDKNSSYKPINSNEHAFINHLSIGAI